MYSFVNDKYVFFLHKLGKFANSESLLKAEFHISFILHQIYAS